MRDLWTGLTLLVLDQELRNEIFAAAAFKEVPDLEQGLEDANAEVQVLHLSNQPNPDAVLKMDEIFGRRGAFVAPYSLAEVNRWVRHGDEFRHALDNLRIVI